jgi:hypothetical protein
VPIVENGTAPYAPSTSILEFMDRNRNGSLPSPVTLQTLERLGISESLRPRTLQALKLLDFIGDDGALTEQFLELRKASTPDYPLKVAEMLRASYAEVFAVVDPSGATYDQVTDAFRGLAPDGQRDRMVSLFLALLAFTGQWENLPAARKRAIVVRPSREASGSRPNKPAAKRIMKTPAPAGGGQRQPQEERARVAPRDDAATILVDFGDAGTVSIDTADVRWLSLPKDSFLRLRELIDEISALGKGEAS